MPGASSDVEAVRIGEWELLPQRNLLRRDGRTTRLEPRHADLLLYLARHPGEVASADLIIEEVWAGQVVTDQSVYQAIARLRRAFGDDAAAPHYIETVSKRGYRLIAEVSEPLAAEPTGATTESAGAPPGGGRFLPLAWLAAGVVVAIAVLGIWSVLRPTPQVAPDATADRETVVAVLPFTVLSDGPDDRQIAAGFAIELAHVLGHSEHLRVIGPVSSALAGTVGDEADDLGLHVDASVVVSGTLRRSPDGIHVSSALTDVPSGYQLWSEVFDRDQYHIVAAQKDVAAAVAAALEATLSGQGKTLAIPESVADTEDRATYDNYLLGRYYRHLRTEQDLQRARRYFQQALAVDPDYAPALRELAAADLLLYFYGSVPLAEASAAATAGLTRALELDPEAPEGLSLIGLSHYLQGNYGLAEDFLVRAVTGHPNLHEAWMWLGMTRQQQGRLNDALVAFEYASKLEPLLITAVVNYAEALLWSGRGDAATELLRGLANKARESMDNREQLFRTLSLVLRHTGELPAAFHWSERALAAAPDSKLSLANKVVLLTLLGLEQDAIALAAQLSDGVLPGRGTMEILGRANISAPGILDHALLSEHLAELQLRPDTPEIEWRLANLDVGMSAYHRNDLDRAAALLDKAIRGRAFPVLRADDDLYACASLVDALERSDRVVAAANQLSECASYRDAAREHGWDSPSLTISDIRLAVLANDDRKARALLAGLFDRGLRNAPLIVNDPVIGRLSEADEYQSLLRRIREAIAAARQSIAGEDGAGLSN